VARETYVSWLSRFSAQAARESSVWQSGWASAIGMVILLGVILTSVGVCWVAWTRDLEKPEPAAGQAAISSEGVEYQADTDRADP
jgi:hypothetical protein